MPANVTLEYGLAERNYREDFNFIVLYTETYK